MNPGEDSLARQYKWHIVAICTVVGLVIVLMFTTDLFDPSESGKLRSLLILLGGLVFMIALLTMLSRVFKILEALRENSSKLEGVTGALEKISEGLAKINHSTQVSETAKAIAFREADRASLRQAVFEKLQMQDFEGANNIIDEMSHRPEYGDLAEELHAQAEKYRTATSTERVNQMIGHIEKLIDDCQWVQASTHIEELIKDAPDSEKAKALRKSLVEKKEGRKKILLAAWDDAVHQHETDRSLEILKELDHYLTPNEALALRETASDVFKEKLHNLGEQFALLITEKQWNSALDIGRQIIEEFPNSKMAEEITEKMDVLRQNVQMQST